MFIRLFGFYVRVISLVRRVVEKMHNCPKISCLQFLKNPCALNSCVLKLHSTLIFEGGEGKIGKVTDIRGWDAESGRSVAHVTWVSSSSTNVYRVGHKGKVDLKYITAARGSEYYKEHLPVLGRFTLLKLILI